MTLEEKIVRAFAHREMPSETVEMAGRVQIDSDVEDGQWFAGHDWRELTCEDWRRRYCGFFFLSPQAFRYYLPSLLILTVRDPKQYPDLVIQSFLSELDRSPGSEYLDQRIMERYSELTQEEYAAIREWLLFACERIPEAFWGAAAAGPGDGFGRVFDTINLLEKETAQTRPAERGELGATPA